MEVAALVVKSCNMCVGEKCLRCTMTSAFGKGVRSTFGGNMRSSTFLFPKVSYSFYRLKHKVAGRLLETVNVFEKASVSKQPKLLSRVSVFVDYDGLDDIIDSERAGELFNNHKSRNQDFDISLACKRFPSISLGHSPPVELYDGANCGRVESALLAAKIWHVAGTSSSVEDDIAPICSDSPTRKTEARQELESNISQPSRSSAGLEIEDTSVSVQEILDRSISCIPGLTKRQCNQLENCGFHTLRKLLYHYPRTYANLQNAQVGIDDGQYLIFVGKISSSRGIRASSSLSFLEVVVACEVAETSSSSECIIDETENGRTRTIYLHLKKFFRGTRFTFQPFLRSLEGKHKEGDIVCVSGKVRKMRGKDHYEMREYTLDIVHDEEDSSFCRKEKLYPIYPSKAGLKPNFLRDIISREHSIPTNGLPFVSFGGCCAHKIFRK